MTARWNALFGGISSARISEAIIRSDFVRALSPAEKEVKAVLFNIFGGITRGDEVAKGILEALDEVKTDVPMVIRLVGTNAEEGRKLLADADMLTAETLSQAAELAVKAAKEGIAK